jgi:hypothetical protein
MSTTRSKAGRWALAAVCLNAMACFSGFKNSDIRCQKDSQCPSGYACSVSAGSDYGSCLAGKAPTSGTGGSTASTAARDGGPITSATGGTRSATTGSTGGTGGIGSGGSVAAGGAGGVSGGASGGATANPGGASGGNGGVIESTNGGVAGSANGGATGSVGESTPDAATGSGGSAGNKDGGIGLPDAPALLDNGSVCKVGPECASGLCVEGVCCDGKCDGQCESCKESGSVGTCKAVKGAPLAGKTACSGTGTCKGQCDGTNGKVCTYPGSSATCTAASCKEGKATAASVCDGLGACTTPAANACPSNLCSSDGSKCQDNCTSGNCGTEMYCSSTGVCLTKKKAGEKCDTKDECASTFCADGVCCSATCSGQCQACNESGEVGTCTRITGAPRAGHTPCTTSVASCAGSCDGSSDTQCDYPGVEKACTAAKCSTDQTSATSASVCNGAGACSTAQTTNCGASGSYCTGGACTAKLPAGGSCTDNVQCTSGNCSNDTCCGAGLTWCGGACVDLQTSNAHCGACNHACGAQQCMAGLCCAANSVKCGSSCCGPNHACSANVCSCTGAKLSCGECGSWGFDSGPSSTEGWSDPDPGNSGVTAVVINNNHVFEGKYSLAVSFANSGVVEVKPCSSAVSLVGYKLSAKVSLVGTGMPSDGCYVYVSFSSYPGFSTANVYGDAWSDLLYTFPSNPTNDESFLGVGAYCDGFTGTMYIDSVALTK